MASASRIRAWLVVQPDLHLISDTERLSLLAQCSWADRNINQRAETDAFVARHARDGVIHVEISYRNSGWGYDDASSTRTTVPATRKAWDSFVRDLRSDCDGCDAGITVL